MPCPTRTDHPAPGSDARHNIAPGRVLCGIVPGRGLCGAQAATRRAVLAALLALPLAGHTAMPAAAGETLRCQSVNGNLNCAGSGAVSCQTINGRRTCTTGSGAVVQSFGPSAANPDQDEAGDEENSLGEEAESRQMPRRR